ncbi:hypothetical protein AVEN_60749-1 [Araneus ventricosus]|uniref:RING-type domain-containing protein n=1 Tax=Araneus ventricosus TaxID=182803 RepID=A0A4Y2MDD5_ARAVE|nr:hypothetical protein AVEN_60749-1 [Araneus ventricosus]
MGEEGVEESWELMSRSIFSLVGLWALSAPNQVLISQNLCTQMKLPCLDIPFHGLRVRWLERSNSCPLCRGILWKCIFDFAKWERVLVSPDSLRP